jgi:hypothetical protein
VPERDKIQRVVYVPGEIVKERVPEPGADNKPEDQEGIERIEKLAAERRTSTYDAPNPSRYIKPYQRTAKGPTRTISGLSLG